MLVKVYLSSSQLQAIGWLGGLLLAVILGAFWAEAAVDAASFILSAAPKLGTVTAGFGLVATLWLATRSAQGKKFLWGLQVKNFCVCYTG